MSQKKITTTTTTTTTDEEQQSKDVDKKLIKEVELEEEEEPENPRWKDWSRKDLIYMIEYIREIARNAVATTNRYYNMDRPKHLVEETKDTFLYVRDLSGDFERILFEIGDTDVEELYLRYSDDEDSNDEYSNDEDSNDEDSNDEDSNDEDSARNSVKKLEIKGFRGWTN
jgi:hypothetical protein